MQARSSSTSARCHATGSTRCCSPGRRRTPPGRPVVLDPVGVGATTYRTDTAKRILDEVDVAIVRGNAAEIAALAGLEAEIRGVEAIEVGTAAPTIARTAATSLGVVAAVTGPVDHVSDGTRTLAVANGDPLLATITGSGCMATAITGCFAAVRADAPVDAAAFALAALGVAAEDAARERKARARSTRASTTGCTR